MTDEQLITMLYESSPAELSAAQLKELRTRMLASAQVKRAVAHRVRLEQGLTETLGRPHLQTAAIVAACTAAAVSVPIAGGLLGWFKGWGLTVWSGIAAVTVSVPVAVVMMNSPIAPKTTPAVSPQPSAVTAVPIPDPQPEETSPSDDVPEGWVPMNSLAEPSPAPEESEDVTAGQRK